MNSILSLRCSSNKKLFVRKVEEENSTASYIVVAHYENHQPFIPKREMDIDLVDKLEKMGFKPFQIRILFERFKAGKLMLEIEKVLLSTQLSHQASPYDRLMKVLTETYPIDFTNSEITNRMKGVKDLQKYVQYLEKNDIQWTYLNVYHGNSKIKIGSIYSDEPIPKRMIE